MLLKATRFVALMPAALTLGLGFCHLMQLPSRMGWDQYLWVGPTVQGGLFAMLGSVGAVIFVATVIALGLLAYFVREHGQPGFELALSAALLFTLALMLWVLIYPVNVELAKWVDGPGPQTGPLIAPAGNGATPSFVRGISRLRRASRIGSCRHACLCHSDAKADGLDLDFDVSAGDAHIVAGHGLIGRIAENLAGPDIEFGAMPGTGHLMAFDFALGQRPFLMRAGIVEGKELPIDVEQGDLLVLDNHQPACAGSDLACASSLNEFAHDSPSSRQKYACGEPPFQLRPARFTYGWAACRRQGPLP
jgi:hypothetical protein